VRGRASIPAAALAGLILVLLTFAPAASAASQTWVLQNTDHAGVSSWSDSTMAIGGAASGSVTVANGGAHYFIATGSPAVTTDFGSGDWTFNVTLATGLLGARVSVGSMDSTGAYTSASLLARVGSSDSVTLRAPTGAVVPAGDFLALEVIDLDEPFAGEATVITTNGSTTLASPETDPGYPVFETGSAILLGAGLLMVGGVATLRQARRNP
jgi:hypothetical protein